MQNKKNLDYVKYCLEKKAQFLRGKRIRGISKGEKEKGEFKGERKNLSIEDRMGGVEK